MTSSELPYSDLRVLSFTQLVQGPETGKLFADLGADVIRVERPGVGALERHWAGANAVRNGESYLYHSVGRNQRSIAIDLANAEGIGVVHRMLETTDVVIENFRPGSMAKLGLDYESLAPRYPGLVYLSATGYGNDAPYARRPGQDLLIQAVSGLAASTGRADDPPIPTAAAIIDYHASIINAFAVAAALAHRARTGRGQLVETSLYDAALHLQSETLFYALNGWPVGRRSRTGIADLSSPAPYGIYPTRDGYLAISDCPLDTLADALDLEKLRSFTEAEAFSRRDEVRELVAAKTATLTTCELGDVLDTAGLWSGPVVALPDLSSHEQFAYRERTFPVESDVLGEVRHLLPPWRMNSVPDSAIPRTTPPRLGADTDDLLRECSYTDEAIARLRRDGVIEQADRA